MKVHTIRLLDKDFKRVLLIDDFISLVWSKRYSGMGDVVLELPITYAYNQHVRVDNILELPDLGGFMMIEDINPVIDENGMTVLKVTGSSSEKLLCCRTIDFQLMIEDQLPGSVITQLMNENIFSPVNTARQIQYFSTITIEPITVTLLNELYEPDILYTIIKTICDAYQWGFEVLLSEGPVISLRIYAGLDRSFEQSVNDPVIFSQEMDNLRAADYQISTSQEKNVVKVLTEDTVLSVLEYATVPEPEGRFRKEQILLAQDLYVTRNELGDPIIPEDPEQEYMTPELLQEIAEFRALQEIVANGAFGIFEGIADSYGPYQFNEHYSLGDVVQFDILGHYVRGRVEEIIRTINNEGVSDNVGFDFNLDDIQLLFRD